MLSFKPQKPSRSNTLPTSLNLQSPLSHPVTGMGLERTPRPLNKLSFTGFKRSSSLIVMSPPPPALLVQDGSYLEALSLKLSEAVSKALAQPGGPAPVGELLGGKRPIPVGCGQALGLLIASELKACQTNPHLHRAILRLLHKPLSVLLNNLSALLLPLLSSTAFVVPPTIQAPNPNATQLHALRVAGFAGELLESFDNMGLGLDNDVRGDGLKAVREGLVSLVGRVVNPLIAGIRSDLMPLLESLENPISVTPPKTAAKNGPILHPSIVLLQGLMPVYARALTRYTTALTSQGTLATFLISIIWRALVALAHRPQVTTSPSTTPLGSPQLAPSTKRQRAISGNTALPPARFTLKLPPSRPSSPPSTLVTSTTAADARALHELILLLPRPPMDNDATRVASEAVDEAFADLKALVTLLENFDNPVFKLGKSREKTLEEIDDLTADLPTLIALPVILRSLLVESAPIPSVASIINVSKDEYRKNCLSGFGRAEQCSSLVGHRVLDFLSARRSAGSLSHVEQWLANRVDAMEH